MRTLVIRDTFYGGIEEYDYELDNYDRDNFEAWCDLNVDDMHISDWTDLEDIILSNETDEVDFDRYIVYIEND